MENVKIFIWAIISDSDCKNLICDKIDFAAKYYPQNVTKKSKHIYKKKKKINKTEPTI